jgi:hypothetical protein
MPKQLVAHVFFSKCISKPQQDLSAIVLREPEDGTGRIGAVFHAVKPEGGGHFVQNVQSSLRLLPEEGTGGYVMPLFTIRELKDVACIKIHDFSQHCHSHA